MKAIVLALPLLVAAANALAQPIARDRELMEEAQRRQSMLQQRDTEARIQRARDKCLANRGSDCDTMEGLQEWLLLDRSRADAVLDRISPAPSASAGSSNVPGSSAPALSPYNASAAPR